MSDLHPFFHDNDKYEKQLLGQETKVTIDFYDLYNFDIAEADNLLADPEKWIRETKETYLSGKELQITNLIQPTKIRGIDASHINKLITVEAIVVTASVPEATLETAVFKCEACGEIHEIPQDGLKLIKPLECIKPCKNISRFQLKPELCTYVDTQQIRLQERPEELPPGEIPEPLDTLLKDVLIRSASPGDRVKITGIVRVKPTRGRGLDFVKVLEANNVDVLNRNVANSRLSPERIEEIIALSQREDLEDVLINSYCPSIYGWKHVKKALIRCHFGGVKKDKQGSDVRGVIHCLLTGDPGIAKTVLLLFGKTVCIRGVYDTGRGVTGVGLTAALTKQDDKYVLAAGTLALADMGNAFLDEFEKMNKEDREMIHVPMENGIITVSKGGLKATLNSRCSIVAAMNPVDGRYNSYKSLTENLRRKPEDFPDSLISRFDLIFIMVDEVIAERDSAVAERMLGLDSVNTKDIISKELFRDYIAYSKQFMPVIPDAVKQRIKEYYEEKRVEMRQNQMKVFTPRQLESIERLTEARARMYLREEATLEDLQDSIWLHEIYVNETWRDPYTNEVDTAPMMGLPSDSLQKQAEYIPTIIRSIYRSGRGQIGVDGKLYVTRGDLITELTKNGVIDKGRANQVVDRAITLDLIWSSIDKIKISGPNENQMLE